MVKLWWFIRMSAEEDGPFMFFQFADVAALATGDKFLKTWRSMTGQTKLHQVPAVIKSLCVHIVDAQQQQL